jgi:hypothetical protein
MNLSGSFNLTDRFDAVPSEAAASGNVPTLNQAAFKVVAGKISKDVKDFKTVTRQVIANLEGGYYNPKPEYNHPGSRDPRYTSSGETMFGIDRKAGGTINTTPAGKKFWGKIDEIQKTTKWKWNYVPPDPLQTELINLVAEIQEPEFNKLLKRYVNDDKVEAVIRSDGRLLFNFVYAVWNGPGWFKGWAREIKKAYYRGQTSSEDLLKLFVAKRIDSVNVLGKGPVRGGTAWSLINQGGLKIAKLVGVVV